MKVRTFDLSTGEAIECELIGITGFSGMFRLKRGDGKTIIRHVDRCSYDDEEYKKWMDETYGWAVEAVRKNKEHAGQK